MSHLSYGVAVAVGAFVVEVLAADVAMSPYDQLSSRTCIEVVPDASVVHVLDLYCDARLYSCRKHSCLLFTARDTKGWKMLFNIMQFLPINF